MHLYPYYYNILSTYHSPYPRVYMAYFFKGARACCVWRGDDNKDDDNHENNNFNYPCDVNREEAAVANHDTLVYQVARAHTRSVCYATLLHLLVWVCVGGSTMAVLAVLRGCVDVDPDRVVSQNGLYVLGNKNNPKSSGTSHHTI